MKYRPAGWNPFPYVSPKDYGIMPVQHGDKIEMRVIFLNKNFSEETKERLKRDVHEYYEQMKRSDPDSVFSWDR